MQERIKDKENGLPFPPRRKVHPSNKMKMIRLFYYVLVSAFLALTAGLVFWGMRMLE